jgi:hypothetical protein
MSARAAALADEFEDVNTTLIELVETLSPEQWTAHSRPENCTVAALAYHVANAHVFLVKMAQTIADGEPLPPFDRAALDKRNAENARQNAAGDRATAVQLLRRNGADAAAQVRAMSDEQLDRSQSLASLAGAEFSAESLIQNALIGHPRDHTHSIRTAISEGASD